MSAAGYTYSNSRTRFDEAFSKTKQSLKESTRWPGGSDLGGEKTESGRTADQHLRLSHHEVDKDSAVLEISPEAIDALAEESSLTILHKEEAISVTSAPKTTFRRSKVQNTSLAIHFSAPRAPLRTVQNYPQISKSDDKGPVRFKKEWTPPKRENWQAQKAALKDKFPDGWNPLKRLSPDALAGIRALHAQMPEQYTTSVLAENFQVSPEAIRKILKSKWTPKPEEETDRQKRWFSRGEKIWSRYAQLGVKPPAKWRELGIGRGRNETAVLQAPSAAIPTTTRRPGHNCESQSEVDIHSLADRIL